MYRRTLIKAVFGLALGFAVLPAMARAEPSVDQAGKFVTVLANNAITMVADKSLNESERDDRFRKLFVANFDIPTIGKFVLARYWRVATPEQRGEFLKLFEDQQVLTWAHRFKDYSGERLQVAGGERENAHEWLINSQITRIKGPPIPVQWRLRDEPDGSYRVTDLIVEGVSMAITQRSDYASVLQGMSGQIDQLLSSMRTKIDQMKAAG